MKKLTILLLLLTAISILSAQSLFDKPIRSVGFGLGWYNPTLKYINDTLTSPQANLIVDEAGNSVAAPYKEKMKGTFMTNAMLELNLASPFYVRLSAGHWSQQVTKHEVDAFYGDNAFEKTKVSLIPLTADIIFTVPFLEDFVSGTEAYVGAGAGLCFVDEKVQIYEHGRILEVEDKTSNGKDMIYHALIGVEQPLFNTKFSYKIEYDATFGNYSKTGTRLMNNQGKDIEISMGGYRLSASLVYKF